MEYEMEQLDRSIRISELIKERLKEFANQERSRSNGHERRFDNQEKIYKNLFDKLSNIRTDINRFTGSDLNNMKISDALLPVYGTDSFVGSASSDSGVSLLTQNLEVIFKEINISTYQSEEEYKDALTRAFSYLKNEVDWHHINEIILSIQTNLLTWQFSYYSKQLMEIEASKKDLEALKAEIPIIRNNIQSQTLISSFEKAVKEIKTAKFCWYFVFFGLMMLIIFSDIFIIRMKEILSPEILKMLKIEPTIKLPIPSTDITHLDVFLRTLPLFLPLISVAWFAVKRLNVLSKLEMDYQFKIVTAQTFGSYKNETEGLQDDELKKQLLSTVIRNFGDNPVRLFDPKDDKGHTTEELLELAKKLKDITK
jgi:hypothetical protein